MSREKDLHIASIITHLGLVCDAHYYSGTVIESERRDVSPVALETTIHRVQDDVAVAKALASPNPVTRGFITSLVAIASEYAEETTALRDYAALRDSEVDRPDGFIMGLIYTSMMMQKIHDQSGKACLFIRRDHRMGEYSSSPLLGVSNDKEADARIRDRYPSPEFIKKQDVVASINGNIKHIAHMLKSEPKHVLTAVQTDTATHGMVSH